MTIGSGPPSGFPTNTPTFDPNGSLAGVDFQLNPRSVEAPDRPLVLPQIFIKHLEKANAIPSVKNILKFKLVNTGAQNITYFTHGQEGQDIMILGDGHSVLKHDVTKIKNISGADISPAATNTIYKYILMNGIWIQH